MDPEETRIFTAIITAVGVIGVIIGYFAVSIIRQQRRNMELQKANALAEISAMEKERERIAADLHDDLGPLMSVVKFRVDHVAEGLEGEGRNELTKASNQLDDLVSRLREVANNLMPSVLKRKGLFSAIEEYITGVERTSKLRVQLDDLTKSKMDELMTIHIYRIIQEIIHNCLKHSSASLLNISFEDNDGKLTIRTQDNGKGFDTNKINRDSKGIGMRSLNNRCAMLGGSMIVDSKPDKGTIFLFEIPLR
jgi:signal transduction histidine kinase